MKRVFLMVLLLLSFVTPALAGEVLVYSDELDEYFSGKKGERYFSPHSGCEVPAGFFISDVLRYFNDNYGVGSGGTPTGVKVYIKEMQNGSTTYYLILKLTSRNCNGKSACDIYKNLFTPPASDCNFKVMTSGVCRDGDGNVAKKYYTIKSSDGRTAEYEYKIDPDVQCNEDLTLCMGSDEDCYDSFNPSSEPGSGVGSDKPYADPGGDDRNCQPLLTNEGIKTICFPPGQKPDDKDFTDDWYDRCVKKESDGTYKINPECNPGGGTGNGDGGGGNTDNTTDGWFERCVYKDENGTYKMKPDCIGSGGGTGGGGNGGTDYSDAMAAIAGKLDDILGALGGSGGSGSGNGSGNGSGDGEGGGGSWSGDGGFGGMGSAEGMDKGESDVKGVLDGLMTSINNNDTIKLIKGHKYINTSSPVCTYSFTIWGHTQDVSFCEYEGILRKLGHVLFGLVTLLGFVHVVRSI